MGVHDYSYIAINRVMLDGSVITLYAFDICTGRVAEFDYADIADKCYFGIDILRLPTLSADKFSLSGIGIVLLGYGVVNGVTLYVFSMGGKRLYTVTEDYLVRHKDMAINYYVDNDILFYNNNVIPYLDYDAFTMQTYVYLGELSTAQGTSGGVGVKYLGLDIRNGLVGVVKFPSVSFGEFNDCKNELLCYDLGCLLGVPCCRVTHGFSEGLDCIMSVFEYDYGRETIMSFRNVLGVKCNDALDLRALEQLYGFNFLLEYYKTVAFDYVMHQIDRHLSNIAIYNGHVYPLYDNGRCLVCNGGLWADRQYYLLGSLGKQLRSSLLPHGITRDMFKSVLSTYYSEQVASELTEQVYERYCYITGE